MDWFLLDRDFRHQSVNVLNIQANFHGEKMRSFLSEISPDEKLFRGFESIPLDN